MSRGWTVALIVALIALLILVGLALLRESTKSWRRHSSGGEVIEIEGAQGAERCLTCHDNVSRMGADTTSDAHQHLRGSHTLSVMGCVPCHGGDGQALQPDRAHAHVGPRAMLPSRLRGARCAACHPPGAIDATQIVTRGLDLYLELGCQVCHGLPAAGDTGLTATSGPMLDDVARLDSRALLRLLQDPKQELGPGTEMPAFDKALKKPRDRDGLLAYLQAQRQAQPMARVHTDIDTPCASCHAQAIDPGRFEHHCPELIGGNRDYRCQRCHSSVVAKLSTCLFVDGQRFRCAACHDIREAL